jgi:hypothetical protein
MAMAAHHNRPALAADASQVTRQNARRNGATLPPRKFDMR